MLHIAICNANKRQRNDLIDYIAKDTDIEDDYTTECFATGQEIIDRIVENDFRFDLLFLEISLNGIDGIKVACFIREQNVDIDIIFMSDSDKYINDAFRCKAINYIVAPCTYERFQIEMRQYLKDRREFQNENLTILIQGREEFISLNTVLYFESDVRKIGIHFANSNEEIWFYGKLDDLQERLEKSGFIRCHQSYLVNIYKILSVTKEAVKTKRGPIPISRKYSASVKEKWVKHKKANIFASCKYKNNISQNEFVKDETLIEENSTVALTSRDEALKPQYGLVIGMRGDRHNDTFRLYHEESIIVGRDSNKCQVVIRDSTISRIHCEIKYNAIEDCYYVFDYSTNGTFVCDENRLPEQTWVKVERDNVVRLTNRKISFVLL